MTRKRWCVDCGDEFELLPSPGPKRKRCYTCSPSTAGQPKKAKKAKKVKVKGKPRAPADLPLEEDLLGPPVRPEVPDDEEILDWWTAYDRGDSIEWIAKMWERPIKLVLEKLNELDVLHDPPHPVVPRAVPTPNPDLMDEVLVHRVLHGKGTPREKAIMEALGRLRSGYDPDDVPARQPLASVRVNIHKVRHRSHQPMSARERQQNEMASSYWRRLVASDMAHLGILPPAYRRRGKSDL